ncbi:MAG: preprotein translocase subunit SecG [bacterium]
MITLILVIHIIVSICLILIVLLQVGKGASLSTLFGGGGGTEAIFGGAGGDVFMKKLTVIFAILFIFTSLTLTIISARRPLSTIIYKKPSVPVGIPEEAEKETAGPEVPPVKSETPQLPESALPSE